jgi:regulatory protein
MLSRTPSKTAPALTLEEIRAKLEQFCAYQDRTEPQVRQKLAALGCPPGNLPALIAHLYEEKMLDPERFARSYVRGKAGTRGWGRVKIKQGLLAQGIPGEVAEMALREEVDAEQAADKLAILLQKKRDILAGKGLGPRDAEQKLIAYLLQKGYPWAEIQLALRASKAAT